MCSMLSPLANSRDRGKNSSCHNSGEDLAGRFENEEFDAVPAVPVWPGAEEKASQTLVAG
jgi:hypothetical protein